MRIPRAALWSLPPALLIPLIAALAGAPVWVPWALLAIGLPIVAILVLLSPGTRNVASGTHRWRGADRAALLIPFSRASVGVASLVTVATLAGFGAIAALAAQSLLVTALVAGAVLVISAPLVGMMIGPQTMAAIRDGVIIRIGMIEHFVPWSAIADIRTGPEHGEYADWSFEIAVTERHLIDSNLLGRLHRAMGFFRGVRFGLFLLDVDHDAALRLLNHAWLNPQTIGVGPIPQIGRRLAPLRIEPPRHKRRRGLRGTMRGIAVGIWMFTGGAYPELVGYPRGQRVLIELLLTAIGGAVTGAVVAFVFALWPGDDLGRWAWVTLGGWLLSLALLPGGMLISTGVDRFEPQTLGRKICVGVGVAAIWFMSFAWPIFVADFPDPALMVLAGWGVLAVAFIAWIVVMAVVPKRQGAPEPAVMGDPVTEPPAAVLSEPAEVYAAIQAVLDASITFAIFLTDEAENRFVQIILDEEGKLIAEAASNLILEPEWALREAAIDALRRLGWQDPDAQSPNYYVRLGTVRADDVEAVAGFLLRTLREAYGLGASQMPLLRTG